MGGFSTRMTRIFVSRKRRKSIKVFLPQRTLRTQSKSPPASFTKGGDVQPQGLPLQKGDYNIVIILNILF